MAAPAATASTTNQKQDPQVNFEVVGIDGSVEVYCVPSGHVYVDKPEGRKELGQIFLCCLCLFCSIFWGTRLILDHKPFVSELSRQHSLKFRLESILH